MLVASEHSSCTRAGVIRDVGAYCVSMWSRYCSRGMPPIIGVDGEAFRILRASETPQDIVDFWSGRPVP